MSDSYQTFLDGSTGASRFDVLRFFFRRQQAGIRIATIVQVLAVTNSGAVSAVGFVDVQPLVQQIDGAGNTVNLPPVYNVPYLRIQGGTNAVILDPQVGDLGICLFADRDISAVKSTKAMAAPGSNRSSNLSDGLYLGGILNGVPQQYVQFNSSGITVLSPNFVTVKAPNMKLDGVVEVTGATTFDSTVHVKGAQTNDTTITATGEVQGNGVKLSTHLTSGVTTGSSNSGPPVPG